MSRRAADALVETLVGHGVDRIFCVPGESFMAALDALYDCAAIDLVTCRHEGGAGLMAVADAKLTGRTGVVMASRGPGGTNASIAIHTAEQDAVPLLVLIGHIERKDIGRGAFQEVDWAMTLGDMAKGVELVTDPDRLPVALAEALHLAHSGTPGPVALVLPEDLLFADCAAPAAAPLPIDSTAASEADLIAAAEMLAAAERPLLLAGGGCETPSGRAALQAFAEAWSVPVAPTFKRQDLFDNRHPLYAGYLGYVVPAEHSALLAEADLVLAVGTRLGDVSTQGYRFPRAPDPDQPLVHVHRDPDQIGRNFRTALGIATEPEAFLTAMASRNPPLPPERRAAWIGRLGELVGRLSAWPGDADPPADGVDFGLVARNACAHLSDDAVIATDAGTFSSWFHRHYAMRPGQIMLGAVAGAMGLGVPGTVAAALRHPGRQVLGVVGDGGFLMTGNELAVAVERGLDLCLLVHDNRSYGTIRLHQEKAYPGRTIATDLTNPDFARLANAFGATGLTIADPDQVEPVLAQARATRGPVVVHVRASLARASAYATLPVGDS